MRFLIIGGGSIGRRHLVNLQSLSQVVSVVEPIKSRAQDIERKYRVKTYLKLDEVLNNECDAAVICNPNKYHIPMAIRMAKRGIHLFIEKPLSHNLSGVNELIRLVEKNKLHTFMGSNFKFHPSFRIMKKLLDDGAIGRILAFSVTSGQYLPDWHPWEDYRRGYSANRSLGGGILLDSHEFDYIQWFLGPIRRIACFTDKYSNLEIDTEDIAVSMVELKDRIIGSVQVDYIQRPYNRRYYFYGQDGTLEWNHREKMVSLYKARKKKWQFFREDKNYDSNQMYIEEIRHFLNVLKEKEKPITDIYTAKKILKVIQAAKKSSRLKRFIEVD